MYQLSAICVSSVIAMLSTITFLGNILIVALAFANLILNIFLSIFDVFKDEHLFGEVVFLKRLLIYSIKFLKLLHSVSFFSNLFLRNLLQRRWFRLCLKTFNVISDPRTLYIFSDHMLKTFLKYGLWLLLFYW